MSPKPHNHGSGHSCEGHGTDDNPEVGVEYSLYSRIDKENMECLNEVVEGSGKSVFKPWEERLSQDTYVESDADEELLFNIPFTGNVKLKGIIIIGSADGAHPSRMRLFKNKPRMTFDDVCLEPDQEFNMQPDLNGTLEYAPKIVTFNTVHHLTIHIPSNFGAETTRIYYIGLRGEFSESHHHGVTICVYEAKPNVSDHKCIIDSKMHHQIQ